MPRGRGLGWGWRRTAKVAWMALRTGAEPVPLCPVYPPAPSWLQRKSLCCSETKSSDPDCFPSRGLKSVGKQTQLKRMNLVSFLKKKKGLGKEEGALGTLGGPLV